MGTGENQAHAVKEIEANGLRFAYLEEGTGPLIIFFFCTAFRTTHGPTAAS
jgi:hypothetical protein